MKELLVQIVPNVVEFFPELLKALRETTYTVVISTLIAAACGLPIGIILYITAPKQLCYNKVVYEIISKIISVLRSVPFVILLTAIVPFTRLVVGTTIGIKGAMVPLVVAAVPFIARQVEVALYQVNQGVVEAAQAMGFSPIEIIIKVIIRESLPGLVQAITISIISLIGLSAMAGTVGGGGLGDFAIRYGYQYFKTDIMVVTVVILVTIVALIQAIGEYIRRKLTR